MCLSGYSTPEGRDLHPQNPRKKLSKHAILLPIQVETRGGFLEREPVSVSHAPQPPSINTYTHTCSTQYEQEHVYSHAYSQKKGVNITHVLYYKEA